MIQKPPPEPLWKGQHAEIITLASRELQRLMPEISMYRRVHYKQVALPPNGLKVWDYWFQFKHPEFPGIVLNNTFRFGDGLVGPFAVARLIQKWAWSVKEDIDRALCDRICHL